VVRMNDINDITPVTSCYEVLSHLTEKIVSADLSTFEALKRYVSPLPDDPRLESMLKSSFDLQRRLYWGFFKDVTPEAFPRLWEQIVVPDRDYPFAGDLKRFMSIQDVYLCMIDIHGYTRFCRENRHNMSMLDLLDKMLQLDVPRLAAESGVIARRAHGDEILLFGPSAGATLEAVLRVVDYFGKRRRLSDGSPSKDKPSLVLPEFFISAGIAGGQTYASLVITRDGDISGDLVNAAARLQARANQIAPELNKILLTSHAYRKIKSQPEAWRTIDGITKIDFFNDGPVEFKGIELTVYETVFLATEAHRLSYRDAMEELYEAIAAGAWKSKIFELSLKVAITAIENLPPEGAKAAKGLLATARSALEHFAAERYEKATASLGTLVDGLELVPSADGLVVLYLRGIADNYARIASAFLASLDREIDDNLETLYGLKELENLRLLRASRDRYEAFRSSARLQARGRKTAWFREADKAAPELSVRIASRK
jgi:class 3 adenylate cyclase